MCPAYAYGPVGALHASLLARPWVLFQFKQPIIGFQYIRVFAEPPSLFSGAVRGIDEQGFNVGDASI